MKDTVRAGLRWIASPLRAGLSRGTTLVQVWGGLSVLIGLIGLIGLVGLITIVGSLDAPLPARGYQVGSGDLSVSLGEYNTVGGPVLLLTGALLLAVPHVSAVTGTRSAITAAGLALVAAVSLYVQLGFSDPVLGGSATSAAYLLCFAAVALAAAAGTATVPGPRCASAPSEAT